MTLKREKDQWFWVASGKKAVAMARACEVRARQEKRPDIAASWDRRAQQHKADPTKVMKVKLPQEFVDRYINAPRYFNGPAWYDYRGDEW